MGLNNNTISAKDEPMNSPGSSPRNYRNSPLEGARNYHRGSPVENNAGAASSMHLEEKIDDENQAEDLSNKAPSDGSPLNSQSRYHPYCHSEIMIKSE